MGLTLAAQGASYSGELQAEMYRDNGKKRVVVKCIDLMTDSQSAKSLAENPVYHGRSKHILAKWHFIRQRVTKGWIKLFDVRTESMGADMMTKAVGPSVLAVNMKLIGMHKSRSLVKGWTFQIKRVCWIPGNLRVTESFVI